ncbi:ATP-binding protein [Arthrobacter sp. GMC3]|uniref:ATP-binding protein n=1 Tax=Arthrobacter sp. GMC3 TaxID=2058894 RepID=UPI000CE445A4|nr:ATP-binding protein [Arthrobacter sp. GMC3]
MTVPENPTVGEYRAVSLDGRRFQFTAALESALESGSFVILRSETEAVQLGQVDDVSISHGDTLRGAGRILGAVSEGGTLDSRHSFPFAAAEIEHADAKTIELMHGNTVNPLVIGSYLSSEHIPACLLPNRFNRHTFWCGQSGSGKTYALGVVLEQILLHTSLPMVIFDPNADFVRLREPNLGGGQPAASSSIAARDIRILRPGSADPDSLRVRFTELSLPSQAAVLRLHSLEDRAEYNELVHLEQSLGTLASELIVPNLRERETTAATALAARIENLQVTDWEIWAGGASNVITVTDVIESRPDATVLDLGGFSYPDESLVVAMAVLEDLWAKREQRRPILIVIDEAHNLCSSEQNSPLNVAVRERIIQIAAEGRKFGLWLLLSTQRPSRVHPSIISQCDNLALMKMTSPADLDELATIFGFVPAAMLARSPSFRQGEALFAGGFVPAPALVSMGARLTQEGGADVSVPMRS